MWESSTGASILQMGCTQDAHLDPDAVTGRLMPPLQVCPWDSLHTGVLLLLIPPTHVVLSQWQELPVSRCPMLLMLWPMGPRGAGAAQARLQLRGAGSTPGSTSLARGTACVGAATNPGKGRMLLTSLGMKGSCKG